MLGEINGEGVGHLMKSEGSEVAERNSMTQRRGSTGSDTSPGRASAREVTLSSSGRLPHTQCQAGCSPASGFPMKLAPSRTELPRCRSSGGWLAQRAFRALRRQGEMLGHPRARLWGDTPRRSPALLRAGRRRSRPGIFRQGFPVLQGEDAKISQVR